MESNTNKDKNEKKVNKEISYKKYRINMSSPVENKLLSLEAAIKYLENNIKVNGLKGKLGESIKVSISEKKSSDKNNILILVDNKIEFSKKYIKYLLKKFLKREGIVNYLSINSSSPNSYTVKVLRKNE